MPSGSTTETVDGVQRKRRGTARAKQSQAAAEVQPTDTAVEQQKPRRKYNKKTAIQQSQADAELQLDNAVPKQKRARRTKTAATQSPSQRTRGKSSRSKACKASTQQKPDTKNQQPPMRPILQAFFKANSFPTHTLADGCWQQCVPAEEDAVAAALGDAGEPSSLDEGSGAGVDEALK